MNPTGTRGKTTQGQKPVGTKKTVVQKRAKALRIGEVTRKRAKRPRWLWIVVGGVVLVAVVVVSILLFARNAEGPRPSAASRGMGNVAGLSQTSTPSAVSPIPLPPSEAGPSERLLAVIKAVRLMPSQPTRTDSLRAEVTAAPGAREGLVYTYRWKVNDGIVGAATGETLSLSAFKKGDRVGVTVTPRDGDTVGFAVESPEIVIHSVLPTLEMKIIPSTGKITDPVEVQLLSAAPDSAQVAFSLEPPHIPGMTIDRVSGKITWPRKPDEKGTFRFGAAVDDEHRAKVAKVFEISVK